MEKSLVYLSENSRKFSFPALMVAAGALLYIAEFSLLWAVLLAPVLLLSAMALVQMYFGGEVLLLGRDMAVHVEMGGLRVRARVLLRRDGQIAASQNPRTGLLELTQGERVLAFGRFVLPDLRSAVCREVQEDLQQIDRGPGA